MFSHSWKEIRREKFACFNFGTYFFFPDRILQNYSSWSVKALGNLLVNYEISRFCQSFSYVITSFYTCVMLILRRFEHFLITLIKMESNCMINETFFYEIHLSKKLGRNFSCYSNFSSVILAIGIHMIRKFLFFNWKSLIGSFSIKFSECKILDQMYRAKKNIDLIWSINFGQN